jgi:RimJ/RimL family protein N-acetyltransferase
MAVATSVSNLVSTYYGKAEINFFSDAERGLSVTIDTKRMHMRSVESTETDYDHYADLFGDQEVMEKYATGQTKTKEEMRTRIDTVWVKRQLEGDPFAGLAIFKKNTDDFLGHIVLGHGDIPGAGEVAYLFKQKVWGNRYGSEAVEAVVKEFAPAIVKEGYTLEGKPLEKILATSRADNIASCRILEKVGMHLDRVEEKHGAMRNHYSLLVSPLKV